MDSLEKEIRNELSEKEITNQLTKNGIPEHLHGGLVRYVVHRIPPGHFMTALLSNDLLGTINRADDLNVSLIKSWLMVLYNCEEIPSGCWGSKDRVEDWLSGEGENP